MKQLSFFEYIINLESFFQLLTCSYETSEFFIILHIPVSTRHSLSSIDSSHPIKIKLIFRKKKPTLQSTFTVTDCFSLQRSVI